MAPPAIEATGITAWLGRQLAPQPGRLAFAIKLAIICSLTAVATAVYRTPEPALTAYLAFFLNARDRAASLLMEVLFTLIVAVLIVIVTAIAGLVLDHAAWRVAAIALLSFGLLFMASASKLKPLAPILALIIGYALDVLGMVPGGEVATRGLLYAWLFVAIPAQVSIVFNIAFGQPPRLLATREMARRLALCADLLAAPQPQTRSRARACLADGGAEVRHWLKLAKAELGVRPADLAHLEQAASSTLEILAASLLVERSAAGPDDAPGAFAQTLRQMAAILERGGYPIEITLEPAPQAADPLTRQALASLHRAIVDFAEPAAAPEPKASPAPEGGGGLFVADAFSNPVHLQYAFKITAAAMFCYLFYTALDWPGIHTCFITCYIVGLGTVAESVEKLALRIGGAVVGAALGLCALLFVMPHVVGVGGLAAVVLVGALAAGYVAGGSPRIAYVGFQIAFAFFLCTLEGAGPSFDMKTIRDRLIGIVVGNLAVYLVTTRLWPSSVAPRIDGALARAMRTLGAAINSPAHTARPKAASDVYACLETIEADLGLARLEPGPIRAAESWLSPRRAALEDLGRLQDAVLVAGVLPDGATLAQRLERLAARPGAMVQAPGEDPSATAARSIDDLIEEALRRLEAAMPVQDEGERHAPA